MEKVEQMQAQIKEIKAMYGEKKKSIRDKRDQISCQIEVLKAGMIVTLQQISTLKGEYGTLGKELEKLDHECKEATRPLRTLIWKHMEGLRKELQAHEELNHE